MHIFSSNYEDLNFDFVIYLNPLYNDYDNDDQDIYHPQYYKYLENELPLKYSYEADNYIDYINHVLFKNLHLEKDNDNTNSPDYNPDDTNIWIHYGFKPNKYGLKNCYINICYKDIRLLYFRNNGHLFDNELDEAKYLTNNYGGAELNGELYDFDTFCSELYDQADNIMFTCFINSKDIRNYLREISYKFTPLEVSWLIYQCRSLSLAEKHKEWHYLIDNTKDMAFDTSESKEDSLHSFLKRYMEMQKKYIDIFMNPDNSFYKYKVTVTQSDNYTYETENNSCFSTYEKCLQAAKDECIDYSDSNYKNYSLCIMKKELDSISTIHIDDRLELYLNSNYEIMHVEPYITTVADKDTLTAFDYMWFSFPTPFKTGDIIAGKYTSPGICRGPMVLNHSAPEWYNKKDRKGRDISDMWMNGYFQDSDTGCIYNGTSNDNYMDFEYCLPDSLTGKQRILIALSNYLKGQIDISLMLNAYHLILLEEAVKDRRPREFTAKALELAGLEKSDK